MNIFLCNTYKTDLDWIHYDNDTRIHEKEHKKEQQPHTPTLHLIQHIKQQLGVLAHT